MIPDNYNNYKLSRKEKQNYFTLSILLLSFCGYIYYENIFITAIMACASILGIPYYKKMMSKKRKRELRFQFKDMLYSISSSITSGRHLGEAVVDSLKPVSLIHGEDCILAREIKNMCKIMQETNCSEETVLRDLAERSHVKEIADFTDSCITCRTTGGNLNKLILKAVFVLTQNIELEREKEVLLSQKKLESRILTCMPIAVIAMINIMSADYLDTMYSTIIGRFIMTLSLGLTVGSFIWSMKLTENS